MIVTPALLDLGTIPIAIPVKGIFVFTAEAFPITLTKISAGCQSCTVASADKSILEANTSMNFNITFTPKVTGEQEKKVNVTYSEDNILHTIVLTFKATVTQ